MSPDVGPGEVGARPVQSNRRTVPGWVVLVAVLATAAVMVYFSTRSKSGLDPVTRLARQTTQAMSPGVAAFAPQAMPVAFPAASPVAQQQAVQLVNPLALVPTATVALAAPPEPRAAPAIRQFSASPHEDRGACTACHLVVDQQGTRIPVIRAASALPHEFRGVCVNCHQIGVLPAQTAQTQATTVAANTLMFPSQGLLMAAAVAPAATVAPAAAPAKPKTEGEWLGLEVVPINALIATQYGIPSNVTGLVCAEAEAQAATAGFRAGDVIRAVNATPIGDMTSFFQATKNGLLPGGVVDIVRGGQPARLGIGPSSTPAAPAPAAANPGGQPAGWPRPVVDSVTGASPGWGTPPNAATPVAGTRGF